MKSHVIALKNLVLVALTVVIPVLSASAQTPTPSPFSSDESTQRPPITVVGQPVPLSGGTVVVPTPDLQASATDTASPREQVPGAAVARNGPLTGIAQLRGLSDDRVGVLVNGMQITPACPNHMDPPLLYIAPSQLHSLTVLPGITPVSLGGDNIGGMVLTERSRLASRELQTRFSPASSVRFIGSAMMASESKFSERIRAGYGQLLRAKSGGSAVSGKFNF